MWKDIRLMRVDAGINQKQLAGALQWNRETLIDIERGRLGIDQPTYERILKAIITIETRSLKGQTK